MHVQLKNSMTIVIFFFIVIFQHIFSIIWFFLDPALTKKESTDKQSVSGEINIYNII